MTPHARVSANALYRRYQQLRKRVRMRCHYEMLVFDLHFNSSYVKPLMTKIHCTCLAEMSQKVAPSGCEAEEVNGCSGNREIEGAASFRTTST